MANALTALNKEVWSDEMQIIREKMTVAMELANTELRAKLNNGDKAHKPYRNNLYAVNYTKATALTAQDISATDEYLDVDQIKAVPVYLDDIDAIQNSYETRSEFARDMQEDLSRQMDAKFLAEVSNATSDVDDGDVGGTDGDPITLSTSNVSSVFTAAGRKLNQLNVKQSERFAVITPGFLEQLQLYLSSKDTAFGDKVGMNGLVGTRFGFEIYVSNNLPYYAKWTPADNPTEDDTITINGVTFTFKAAPVLPGAVDIGGSTAVTIDNLVTLLDAPATTTATGIAVSQADQAKLEGMDATDGTTYLQIDVQGGGELAVAGSEVADVWSDETVYCMFGRKGAVDMVVQQAPTLKVQDATSNLKLGTYLIAFDLYGVKTFADGADALVEVNVAPAV